VLSVVDGRWKRDGWSVRVEVGVLSSEMRGHRVSGCADLGVDVRDLSWASRPRPAAT
jgi:hypothetical protein